MPSMAEHDIAMAASQIGHYGDYNKYNEWYWTPILGYDPGYAWCAVFQSWCTDQIGFDCIHTASSAAFGTQFQRVYEPQRGDFVLFNWDGRSDQSWTDHIGLVEWYDASSGYFGTIEGNTGYGDVARCTRTINGGYYVAFYRPTWESEEDMDEEKFWSYRNPSLEKDDVYQIVRDARDYAKKAAQAAEKAQAAAEKASAGGIDYAKLAKVVNDDAAARMRA